MWFYCTLHNTTKLQFRSIMYNGITISLYFFCQSQWHQHLFPNYNPTGGLKLCNCMLLLFICISLVYWWGDYSNSQTCEQKWKKTKSHTRVYYFLGCGNARIVNLVPMADATLWFILCCGRTYQLNMPRTLTLPKRTYVIISLAWLLNNVIWHWLHSIVSFDDN